MDPGYTGKARRAVRFRIYPETGERVDFVKLIGATLNFSERLRFSAKKSNGSV